MAKKKKKKKKKNKTSAGGTAATDDATAQPPPSMPTHWPEPECLPTWLDVPSCTCYKSIMREK